MTNFKMFQVGFVFEKNNGQSHEQVCGSDRSQAEALQWKREQEAKLTKEGQNPDGEWITPFCRANIMQEDNFVVIPVRALYGVCSGAYKAVEGILLSLGGEEVRCSYNEGVVAHVCPEGMDLGYGADLPAIRVRAEALPHHVRVSLKMRGFNIRANLS